MYTVCFFFSSRRRHTRSKRDWSSDVCSSDLPSSRERIAELHGRGMTDATFYDASDSSVRGTHAMFIVRGDPRSYNLPPKPEVPTIYLKKGWTSSAIGAGLLLAGSLLAFLFENGRDGR